jgi:hypothetical protein
MAKRKKGGKKRPPADRDSQQQPPEPTWPDPQARPAGPPQAPHPPLFFGQGHYGQGWFGHPHPTPGFSGYFGGFGTGTPYIDFHHDQPHYAPPVQTSDADLARMISTALDNDPHIPLDSAIEVQVVDRVCTLTGSVRNRRAKLAAGHDAWHCPGIDDVHNTIRIVGRQPPDNGPSSAAPPPPE